jgi:transcriptional regulator with XRE-family HTH domain
VDVREEYRLKRISKRIRLKELAAEIGCTIGLISNWENGRSSMSKTNLMRYIDYIESK